MASNYVIAFSSVSGGGKTTLVRKIAELLGASALFFDDYAALSTYPADLRQWLDQGAEMDEWQTPRLAADLAALRHGEPIISPLNGATLQPSPVILVEEPMGRARAEMAAHIDFVVVIDTPLEVALTRRLLRSLGQKYPQQIEQLTHAQLAQDLLGTVAFLESYLKTERDVYIAVQAQALANSDLVLDGTHSVDAQARQVMAALAERRLQLPPQ